MTLSQFINYWDAESWFDQREISHQRDVEQLQWSRPDQRTNRRAGRLHDRWASFELFQCVVRLGSMLCGVVLKNLLAGVGQRLLRLFTVNH